MNEIKLSDCISDRNKIVDECVLKLDSACQYSQQVHWRVKDRGIRKSYVNKMLVIIAFGSVCLLQEAQYSSLSSPLSRYGYEQTEWRRTFSP